MKTDVLDEAPSGEQSVGYFCVLRLELEQGLHADGVGIAQQSWSLSGTVGWGWASQGVCWGVYYVCIPFLIYIISLENLLHDACDLWLITFKT